LGWTLQFPRTSFLVGHSFTHREIRASEKVAAKPGPTWERSKSGPPGRCSVWPSKRT